MIELTEKDLARPSKSVCPAGSSFIFSMEQMVRLQKLKDTVAAAVVRRVFLGKKRKSALYTLDSSFFDLTKLSSVINKYETGQRLD
jgi:hypothetical protein